MSKSKPKDYSQFMDALRADYTRLEQPSFAASYRRVKRVAAFQEWDIPSMETSRCLQKDMQKLLDLTASVDKIPTIPKPMIVGVDYGRGEQSGTGFFNIEEAKQSHAVDVAISNWEELPNGYIVITAPRFLYDLANRDEISFAKFIQGVIGLRREEAMRSHSGLGRSKRQLQPVDPFPNMFRFFLLPLRFCKPFLKNSIVQRFLSNVHRLTGGRKNV